MRDQVSRTARARVLSDVVLTAGLGVGLTSGLGTPAARAACTMAYQSEDAIAVLLTQKFLGAKAFSTG